jgi:nitrogen fixation/metabolism regulation signal transduction histidine kinase
MTYRNYHLLLVFRILLLLLNVFLTGSTYLLLGKKEILFIPIVLSIILIIQVVDVIIYLNRTSREIERFFNNLGHDDLLEKFDDKKVRPPFRSLYRSFNSIVTRLEKTALENEAHYAYLQNILSSIDTGIISIREDGRIALMNYWAEDLLGIKDNASWEEVKKKHPEFVKKTDQIPPRGNRLIEMTLDNIPRQLSVSQSSVRIMGKGFRVLTLSDIRTEIEQKEIEAWHKLIQILRHEIRNSVTPIASMAETILMLLEDQAGNPRKPEEINTKDMEDIHSSVRTVHRRSEKLYRFVEKYRQLTKLPPPEKSEIRVSELINSLPDLFKSETEETGTTINIENTDPDILLYADGSLVEQVLINLVRNSFEALRNRDGGRIRVYTSDTEHQVIINVEDDGSGIDPTILQDVFLPFYTTKDNGMGIGLSLSRQIMNLHGGTLNVESEPGVSTLFRMVFNK